MKAQRKPQKALDIRTADSVFGNLVKHSITLKLMLFRIKPTLTNEWLQ